MKTKQLDYSVATESNGDLKITCLWGYQKGICVYASPEQWDLAETEVNQYHRNYFPDKTLEQITADHLFYSL